MMPEHESAHAWRLIVEKIKFLKDVQEETFDKIGGKLGVNRSTVKKWYDGDQGGERTPFGAMLRYLRGLGIDLATVLKESIPCSEDFDFIPKVKARPRGGRGGLEASGEVQGYYAFRKDFVARLGVSAPHLALMEVTGDSMEPMISEGDTVLLSHADKDRLEPRTGDILVVRVEEEVLIKKYVREPGVVVLRSENPAYEDQRIPTPLPDSVAILGKVKWIARILK